MKTNTDKQTSTMPKLSKLEYFALIIAAHNQREYLLDSSWAHDSIEMAETLLEKLHARKQQRAR